MGQELNLESDSKVFFLLCSCYVVIVHTGHKFVHPKVMPITQMLNTLIESQHVNSNPDSLIFFTDYEQKYIYDAI